MSESGLQFKGRPKSEQDDSKAIYFHGCGQGGGGPCIVPLGVKGIVVPFKVPKFITYNRKFIFLNPEIVGIRIYTDGGPAGLCSHSIGSEVPFYVGLSSDENGDTQQIAETGVKLSGALSYEFEFSDPSTLPQPTDSAWEAIVYAHIWWGDESYVAQASDEAEDPGVIRIIKHDYDIKI